ncbi:MAG: symporter [Legionella sp.]|uniref:symporter n=1 Tax=Legionella sp. TaxID=459 RepID=UPI002842284C|nr:symporter [Legionella sp.]
MTKQKEAAHFLSRVKHHISTTSNPQLILRILTALGLDELATDNVAYNTFIQHITSEKIDLSKLIGHIEKNIIGNEPLCNLLAYIEENKLISEAELVAAAPTLQLQINMLCIFEALIVTMANGQTFAKEVYDHLVARAGSPAPGNPLVDFFFGTPYEATLFERLKLVSVKPGMLNVVFHRLMGEQVETKDDAKAFIEANHLSSLNAANINVANFSTKDTNTVAGMGVNIFEAAWEDSTHAQQLGGIDNAKAGVGLIMIMENQRYTTNYAMSPHLLPEGISIDETSTYELLPNLKLDTSKKKVSQFNIPKEWRDLYTSWNLAFVLANIDQVFMPIKLLMPTVGGSEPQNYKEVRLLSLFTMGSLFLSESPQKNPLFTNNYTFSNAKLLFKKMGEFNKQYAEKLLYELCPQEERGIDSMYEHIFGTYPTINLAKQLLSFAYNGPKFRFTQAYTENQSNPLFFASQSTTAETVKNNSVENSNLRNSFNQVP